jgi:hypothetical protein
MLHLCYIYYKTVTRMVLILCEEIFCIVCSEKDFQHVSPLKISIHLKHLIHLSTTGMEI